LLCFDSLEGVAFGGTDVFPDALLDGFSVSLQFLFFELLRFEAVFDLFLDLLHEEFLLHLFEERGVALTFGAEYLLPLLFLRLQQLQSICYVLFLLEGCLLLLSPPLLFF
jgi:hypothetical protein